MTTTMTKVLITGATGFIGSWFVETAPYPVITTGREMDLGGDWTHVIHCAIDHDSEHNNTRMAADVYAAAKERGARTVFLSSGAARYKRDEYGRTKAFIENLFDTSFRVYAIMGPRMRYTAPFEFIRQALRGEDITVTANPTRSYIYVEDAVKQMWDLLDVDGIHEIGSDEPVTLAELAKVVAKQTGVNVIRHDLQYMTLDMIRPYYTPSKGTKPTLSIEKQVALTLDWMKQEEFGSDDPLDYDVDELVGGSNDN